MTQRKRPKKDGRDRIYTVKEDGKKALKFTKNIDLKVKSTTLFAFLPPDSVLTLKTNDSEVSVPIDQVLSFDISTLEEAENEPETHQGDLSSTGEVG